MKKIFLIVSFLILSNANASVATCDNVYVGRLNIDSTDGFNKVVFLNNKDDQWGSYWVSLTGWSAEPKKDVMSILLAAKVAGTRVHVRTTEAEGCGIDAGERTLARIQHSHSEKKTYSN